MFELPKEVTGPLTENPRRLVLFAHTKVGKTTLCAALPNALHLDFEPAGTDYVSAMKLNIPRLALQEGVSEAEIIRQIQEKLKTSSYDYIIIDTASDIEDIARKMATNLYKKTVMGKDFKGTDVVSELPQGAGYDFLRRAFDMLYSPFAVFPNKALITLCHVKNASINKDGKDLSAKDLMLTGKLKSIVAQEADAIGHIYRKDKQNIISFKTNLQDLATGARPLHLRDQEFVISEVNDKGEYISYWDKIFLKK